MKKFVGFEFQHGELINEKTGEVIPWGNIYFRIFTDENLNSDEYGCKVADIKVKAVYVASSLGMTNFKLSDDRIVAEFLCKLQNIIGSNIDFVLDLVKGQYAIVGFKVIQEPKK